MELGQDQIVTITPDSVVVVDFDGEPAQGRRFFVDWDAEAAEKGGFASFMDKEIHDQPQAVADTLLGRTDATGALVLDELRISEDALRAIDAVAPIPGATLLEAMRPVMASSVKAQLDAARIEVEQLSIHSPDLDDVFFAVTGRPTAEAAALS